MRFITHDHRHAQNLFDTDPRYALLYREIVDVLEGIGDEQLIQCYEENRRENKKSLSETINRLIKEGLVARGWQAESAIFSDPAYKDGRGKNRWRLDFAKEIGRASCRERV